MGRCNSKLVNLSGKGKALIVTDLHGNFIDYERYLSLWEDYYDYLVITGDFIHGMDGINDASLDILDSIMEYCHDYTGFHVLLGNHEWAHITGLSIFKDARNQKLDFEKNLQKKYGRKWEVKLEEYKEFFRKLPLAVRTSNDVFISHTGPSEEIRNLEEVNIIANPGYRGNSRLSGLLWTRPDNTTEKVLNRFLRNVSCRFSIVGHTIVDGFETLYDKQLIVSSSYSLGRNAYVALNLEKELNTIEDLTGMIKYL